MTFLKQQWLLSSLFLVLLRRQLVSGLNVRTTRLGEARPHSPMDGFRLYDKGSDIDTNVEEEEDIAATFSALIEDLDEEGEQEVVISPGSSSLASNLPNFNGYSFPTGKKFSGYSAFLEQKRPAWISNLRTVNPDDDLDEDGYANLHRQRRSIFKKALKLPLNIARKALSKKKAEPGTLILVRHGESEWNQNKTFTGWADPDLTEQGRREVEHAARLLMAGGYEIDVVFTSRLKRAIRSVWMLLQELNEVYLPVFKSWRLVRTIIIGISLFGALTEFSTGLTLCAERKNVRCTDRTVENGNS